MRECNVCGTMHDDDTDVVEYPVEGFIAYVCETCATLSDDEKLKLIECECCGYAYLDRSGR